MFIIWCWCGVAIRVASKKLLGRGLVMVDVAVVAGLTWSVGKKL